MTERASVTSSCPAPGVMCCPTCALTWSISSFSLLIAALLLPRAIACLASSSLLRRLRTIRESSICPCWANRFTAAIKLSIVAMIRRITNAAARTRTVIVSAVPNHQKCRRAFALDGA